MHRLAVLASSLAVLLLVACQNANTRIAEHSAEFAALDPATRKAIQSGVVQPGFTSDMTTMALGKPTTITTDAAGQTVWLYKVYPVTAYNETIMAGYRRRVVYDPVKRTDDVIVEPIDTKAFPNLVPHTLRIVFQNGRVVSIERVDRV